MCPGRGHRAVRPARHVSRPAADRRPHHGPRPTAKSASPAAPARSNRVHGGPAGAEWRAGGCLPGARAVSAHAAEPSGTITAASFSSTRAPGPAPKATMPRPDFPARRRSGSWEPSPSRRPSRMHVTLAPPPSRHPFCSRRDVHSGRQTPGPPVPAGAGRWLCPPELRSVAQRVADPAILPVPSPLSAALCPHPSCP